MLAEQKSRLAALFDAAAGQLAAAAGVQVALPAVELERPKQAAHGDLACNLALQLARPLKGNPRQIAERLKAAVEALDRESAAGPMLEALEIAGPGFVNLRLRADAKRAVIGRVLRDGAAFGRGERGAQQSVMVEFVSANPTGPLHVGHGRQGALGDALAALLEADGWRVTREFYYNDAGAQIDKLALSVQARARGIAPEDEGFPADGYRGEYIRDIAADYLARRSVAAERIETVTGAGDAGDVEAIRRFAVAYLRHEQDIDLRAFGVRFDNYYLESSLYTEGRVQATVDALVRAGKTYEEAGALWLRTTGYGDDKDRVMRKSDGGYTYFVPDVAYHVTKWQRGFVRAINVQGSDHHGTVARVRAGLQALDAGIPAGYPDYVLHKMVTVMRGGEEVKISKRAGSYVTLRDLINWTGEVRDGDAVRVDEQRGRDAVRYFLVSRKADSEFVFDVDLALARTDENPVYYIQYAHARICSVLAQWGGDAGSLAASVVAGEAALDALQGAREFALAARLASYPETVQSAVDELAPHAIAFYLKDLAAELHSYYNAERVLVDDEAVRTARLALLLATRQVLRNGLALIGVSAPERM
ncbi:MAG: arginine--tRNA ligase [Burkholderiaceae bacterium]|nr:arginine--tRNA ligase [Burkholderiaceae bacterium]MEB2351749.1 arginine--tRNA ligase [Burkholderiaceae bacterium]